MPIATKEVTQADLDKINARKQFTTGELARFLMVAPRTVSKWADIGKLPCYRLPGSLDRRFPVDGVLQFMKDNNMPIPWQVKDKLFGFCVPPISMEGFEFEAHANNPLAAGLVVGGTTFTHAILSDAYGTDTALILARQLQSLNVACRCILLIDPSTSLENFNGINPFLRAVHQPVVPQTIQDFFTQRIEIPRRNKKLQKPQLSSNTHGVS